MTVDRNKYLSPDEMASLVQKARGEASTGPRGHITWLLVDVALQTGLRVSELVRLQVGDVDLRCGALRVLRSKKQGDKHGVPEWLPISPSLAEHLRQHLAWLAKRGGTQCGLRGVSAPGVGAIAKRTDPLFTGQRGALGVQGMQHAWKVICAKAGLPPTVSIHGARHTMAVTMLRATKNLRMVQKQLGHGSVNTTASAYADVPWEDRQEALKAMFG